MFLTNKIVDEANLAIGLPHERGRASGARGRRGAGPARVLAQLDRQLDLCLGPKLMTGPRVVRLDRGFV